MFGRRPPHPIRAIRKELWVLRVYYRAEHAPQALSIAHPKGSRGALPGYLVPLDRAAGDWNALTAKLTPGSYGLVTQDKKLGLNITVVTLHSLPNGAGEAMGSAARESASLRAALEPLLKDEVFVAEIRIAEAGEDGIAAAEWAHRAAERIAGLGRGLTRDMVLKRWWETGDWTDLNRAQGSNIALSNAVVFAITNTDTWVHTLGLHRFGVPELEIFLRDPKHAPVAGRYLLQVGSYLLNGADMQVGEIVGDRKARLGIALDTRRATFWSSLGLDVVVFELRGLDEEGLAQEYADDAVRRL